MDRGRCAASEPCTVSFELWVQNETGQGRGEEGGGEVYGSDTALVVG